jgi:hypothetical protein
MFADLVGERGRPVWNFEPKRFCCLDLTVRAARPANLPDPRIWR